MNSILVNPPKDWDVVVRRRKLQDFKPLTLPAVLALPVGAGIIYSYATNSLLDYREWLVGAGVVLAVTIVFMLWFQSGIPVEEAYRERQKRRLRWEREVLIPYLEHKYDVEFLPTVESIVGNRKHILYNADGQRMQYVVRGVRQEDAYGYGGSLPAPYYVLEDEVWLEEFVPPTEGYYRPMPVKN